MPIQTMADNNQNISALQDSTLYNSLSGQDIYIIKGFGNELNITTSGLEVTLNEGMAVFKGRHITVTPELPKIIIPSNTSTYIGLKYDPDLEETTLSTTGSDNEENFIYLFFIITGDSEVKSTRDIRTFKSNVYKDLLTKNAIITLGMQNNQEISTSNAAKINFDIVKFYNKHSNTIKIIDYSYASKTVKILSLLTIVKINGFLELIGIPGPIDTKYGIDIMKNGQVYASFRFDSSAQFANTYFLIPDIYMSVTNGTEIEFYGYNASTQGSLRISKKSKINISGIDFTEDYVIFTNMYI